MTPYYADEDLTLEGCAATREAVREFEVEGDLGCPICGDASYFHRSENADSAAKGD